MTSIVQAVDVLVEVGISAGLVMGVVGLGRHHDVFLVVVDVVGHGDGLGLRGQTDVEGLEGVGFGLAVCAVVFG